MTCITKKVLPALARTLSIENSKTQEQDLRQKKNIPSKWLKLYKRCEVDWEFTILSWGYVTTADEVQVVRTNFFKFCFEFWNFLYLI